MSVTTVPLRPIARGSVARFWIGMSVLAAAGVGAAIVGTIPVRARFADNDAYLLANGQRDGIYTTHSGVEIRTIAEGNGPHPVDGQVVIVGYTGRLRDGTTFDSNPQVPMLIGSDIPGFDEALKRMRPGGHYEIWIPPAQGYGARAIPNPQTGQTAIPANSVLNFDITVQRVFDRADFEKLVAQMRAARAAQGAGGGEAGPQ